MEWIVGLPALGHTAEGGTVREWLKKVGDGVKRSEPLVVVESDKVSLEIESPADGVLIAIDVMPGSEVPTGTTLGRVGQGPAAPPSAGGTPASRPAEEMAAQPKATPPRPATVSAATEMSLPAAGNGKSRRVRSTPLARRIARDNGIDIATVESSGKHGEVRKDDVLAEIARRKTASARQVVPPAGSPLPVAVQAPAPAQMLPAGLSQMRKAISRSMVEAWRNQPMVTLSRPVDVTELMDWRKRMKQAPTVTGILAALFGRCLARHPRLNGTVDESGIHGSTTVNLAVAVALDDGLVAPVLTKVEMKPIALVDAELATLVYQARAGRLSGDATAGATASLSNLGGFGISTFTPILTPPQICVLGVGAIERVIRETATGFGFRSEMHLSLTFDHRAVDGADGARLLQDFAKLSQTPEQLEVPVTSG
jgi:pyruvate dehydrogenase E2 component (dihydrolipoamide acetyltransferase)